MFRKKHVFIFSHLYESPILLPVYVKHKLELLLHRVRFYAAHSSRSVENIRQSQTFIPGISAGTNFIFVSDSHDRECRNENQRGKIYFCQDQ